MVMVKWSDDTVARYVSTASTGDRKVLQWPSSSLGRLVPSGAGSAWAGQWRRLSGLFSA